VGGGACVSVVGFPSTVEVPVSRIAAVVFSINLSSQFVHVHWVLVHCDRSRVPADPALALPPSCVWCPVCTSGALRAERGVGDGCEWRAAVCWGFGGTSSALKHILYGSDFEFGGVPWASVSVSWRAADDGRGKLAG
jgi:hypothetical protein